MAPSQSAIAPILACPYPSESALAPSHPCSDPSQSAMVPSHSQPGLSKTTTADELCFSKFESDGYGSQTYTAPSRVC